jgi:hypothetical protein
MAVRLSALRAGHTLPVSWCSFMLEAWGLWTKKDMLCDYRKQGFARKANSPSARQETQRNLRNPKVHYSVQKNTTVAPILSRTNPISMSTPRLSDMFRNNSVGIATGYGLDDRRVGVWVPVGSRIFSSPRLPDLLWGPQWVPGTPSLGVKRPGCEADHSAPTSAEVKKIWIYISTPPYAFMA